jgi:hypothetical protein
MTEDRAGLTAAETVVDLVEEDLHLAEAEALIVAETVETGQCSKLFAVTAAKSAKFLLGPQTASLFTVVTVLKKWVMAEEVMPQDRKEMILDPRGKTKTRLRLMLSMLNWIEF